jgi:integral membrane sensor domain MASE1
MLEGFLETHPDHMEGKAKARLENEMKNMDEKQQRDHRVKVNMKHVGVPIVSAALTTAVCGLVLSFGKLMMFKRFGQIILINTVVAIITTLTLEPALLAAMGLHHYHHTAKASVIGVLIMCVTFGFLALIFFGMARGGNGIKGPSGSYLFNPE